MIYPSIFPPEVMTSGAAILAFVGELDDLRQVGLRILSRHGITEPVAGGWYSLQAWLDALREIAALSGPATLKAIGQRVPDTAHWPPGVNSIETVLAELDVAYHLNHRGGEVGRYEYHKEGARSARMLCANPFPCDFDLGLIERVSSKFAPGGCAPVVRHEAASGCRKFGGESCTYLIDW